MVAGYFRKSWCVLHGLPTLAVNTAFLLLIIFIAPDDPALLEARRHSQISCCTLITCPTFAQSGSPQFLQDIQLYLSVKKKRRRETAGGSGGSVTPEQVQCLLLPFWRWVTANAMGSGLSESAYDLGFWGSHTLYYFARVQGLLLLYLIHSQTVP